MTSINENHYRLIDHSTNETYECNTIRTLCLKLNSLRRECQKNESHDYHLLLIDPQTGRILEDCSINSILEKEYLKIKD